MKKKKQQKKEVRSDISDRPEDIFRRITPYEYLLLLILSVGVFFRFYNTPARYGFDFDASRDAILTFLGATQFRIPPLGPASALGPFHFGPVYYYQLILGRLLLPFTYAPWIITGILSVLCISVAYKIGDVLGDKKLGLIIAGLVALSPAQIGPATGLSNPNLVALPAFLAVWLFVKHLKGLPGWKWSFLFGIVLGIGINDHYQMLPLLLLPCITFFFLPGRRLRYAGAVIAGLFIALLPLLVFDSVHEFKNIGGFIFYLTRGKSTAYLPNSWKIYVLDFWPSFLGNVSGMPVFFALGLLLGSGVYGLKLLAAKDWRQPMVLLGVSFLIEIIFLRSISSRESYYLLYLHPFLFVFLAAGVWYLLEQKYGRILRGVLILGIVFMLLSAGKTLLPPESHAETGVIAQYLNTHYPGRAIDIYDCTPHLRGRVMGVVYLLQSAQQMRGDPVAVGIYDSVSCAPDLLSQHIAKQLPLESMHTHYHNNRFIEIVEFKPGEAPEDGRSGWKHINPETVYTDNVEKWFR